ncbi:MAG TPA: hypothetical protein VEA69_06475 [Tepidisphaeraceae bacterium]|nr:hypothetical protein [Tepidisphaeraceae bacterium]
MRGRRVIGAGAAGLLMTAILGGAIACRPTTADGPAQGGPPQVAAPPMATAATPKAFKPVADQRHIENGHVVTAKIISGAQPEGEASFKALKEFGVRTIVSVDGAAPDVEGARKFGMRYVHLPITYSGVDPAQGRAIAKALDELPGPIYVHCHHGKHRSAAAVAVACVYNGMLKPEQATSVLETFGTGANYAGLWQAARDARPLKPEELRDLKIEYVERAKIPKLAEAMVQVDYRWDHLKAIKAAGWKSPKHHPDLDPPHEALQLEELFRELRRTDRTHADRPGYDELMLKSEAATADLRRALTANDAVRADAAFKLIGAACAGCHKGFRD